MLLTFKTLKALSQNLCVLYVEDDAVVREKTHSVLKNIFPLVSTAIDGTDGLEKYNAHFLKTKKYYDLVISDIRMPNLDGIELSKALFKINKNQRVIIISAHDDKEYLIELIKIGVDAFLEKPITSDQMLEVLYETCSSLHKEEILDLGSGFTFNTLTSSLLSDQEPIAISENEAKLLHLLLKSNNQAFNYIDIFNHLYYDAPEKEFSKDSIKSLIKRLRKKLPRELIKNTQQLGYSISLES